MSHQQFNWFIGDSRVHTHACVEEVEIIELLRLPELIPLYHIICDIILGKFRMTLTKEQRKELLAKFYAMDTDRNGVLCRAEIEKCLTESQLPKSVVNVSSV